MSIGRIRQFWHRLRSPKATAYHIGRTPHGHAVHFYDDGSMRLFAAAHAGHARVHMGQVRSNGVGVFRKTALAAAVALASGPTALAEEGEPEEPLDTLETFLEESTVTAQRRPELLGDVPLAVSVFSGEFIKDMNLDNPQQLGVFTPGLAGDSADSFIDVFQLRGIYTFDFGVGGDPSISFFKNGFYQGRNGPVITSFYDIDRVEVTRGPQGFLFGRNSIAGALNTITNRPQLGRATGDVAVDLAQFGRVTLDGVVNVPLGEQGAVRLAAYSSTNDGHVPDAFDPSRDDLMGGDTQAFRLSVRRQSEATDVNLMIEHESREKSGTIYRPVDASWADLQDVFDVDLAGTRYESPGDLADGEGDDTDILSTGIEIDHDFGWATFTSLTGYRDHDYFYAEDFDGSPLRVNHYHQDQAGDYAEQELRLVSDDDGALSWYAGVSWYRENIDVLFTTLSDEDALCAYYNDYGYHNCEDYYAYLGYEFTQNPEDLVERNRVVGRYSGWAAYVDLNLALTERLDVGVGVRHTSDTKRFSNEAYEIDSDLGPYLTLGFTTDGAIEGTKTWRDLAPRALLRFRPNDDWTWYASVTRGYKAGGFGSFTLEPPPEWPTTGVSRRDASPDTFGPEQSLSYEGGVKAMLADGRAQTRLNAYSYTFEDMQVLVPGPGGSFVVDNIGEVDGAGVEWEFQALLGRYFEWRISAAWAATEARGIAALCGDTAACEGNGLGRMPEFSYGTVVQSTVPVQGGDWIARVEAYGQSEVYGGPSLNPDFRLDGWFSATVRVGFAGPNWEVLGYVENVTDERFFNGIVENDGIIPSTAFGPNRPRTAGVRISWSAGD